MNKKSIELLNGWYSVLESDTDEEIRKEMRTEILAYVRGYINALNNQ